MKELHVRNNILKYLPASILKLQLYTFTGNKTKVVFIKIVFPIPTANNNNFLKEDSVQIQSYIHSPSDAIPHLIELSARAITLYKVPVLKSSIPQHLEGDSFLLYLLFYITVCIHVKQTRQTVSSPSQFFCIST